MNNLLNSAAAIGLGVYVLMVTVQGNLAGSSDKADLIDYVISDADYIEFLVAMVAIWAILQWGPSKEIAEPLVITAVLGLLIKVGISNQALLNALQDFGKPNFYGELKSALGVT